MNFFTVGQVLLIVLLIGLIIGIIWRSQQPQYMKDQEYHSYFQNIHSWDPAHMARIDTTKRAPSKSVRVPLAILTFETRKGGYIQIHDENIKSYCQRHGYSYIRKSVCDFPEAHPHNVYWCKFLLLRQLILSNRYDYVMWLDSDSVILQPELDFAKYLNHFNSSVFAGYDVHPELLNAGVLIIKSDDKGKEITKAITDPYLTKPFQNRCVDPTGNLKGEWAGTCYEQGIMNIILSRYKDATTILPPLIIQNSMVCKRNVFLLHYCGQSATMRKACFTQLLDSA